MIKKIYKIYITPLLIVIAGITPWYLFIRFVLKTNLDTLSGCKAGDCFIKPEIFFICCFSMLYIFFVITNLKSESLKDLSDKEAVIQNWFLKYGKTIGLIVALEFVIILIIFIAGIFER